MKNQTEKTKDRLKQAFMELEQQSSFQKITISDICARAGLSRPTFYSYYSSTDDVLREVLQDLMEMISDSRAELFDCQEADPARIPLCQAVRSSETFRALIKDPDLNDIIVRTLYEHRKEVFNELNFKSDLSEEERSMMMYYQLNGCMALVRRSFGMSDAEWDAKRAVVDRFLRRGYGK